MSRPTVLLQKLLNVRASEWKVVTKLFWLQFFQGTGIAFFFTASLFSFLKKFPASELAMILVVSSPLLFLTGWIFSKLEHRLSLTRLGVATILAMTASILFFYAGSQFITNKWFYYLLLAWYYVLYLASNLGFWAITSTLYNVRQSKRLFSVISAGDIPAKFIGYTIAYFFVKTVGPINMLWPAMLFMIGSLPFLFRLSSMGVVVQHQHHPLSDHTAGEVITSNRFISMIKKFTLNTLIRRVAILTFLISCCLAILNYAFYTEVKEGYHNDKSLSNFILLFLAGSQIAALLVKLIFTSRITASLGIKKSLLITPLVLLTLLLLIISAEFYWGGGKLVAYAFGVAAISVEVLRTAINNPVFLSVMQPLSLAERSKAHAIVKGIMDPFAFLFSGLLLIYLNRWHQGFGFLGICLVLAFFTVAWLVSIVLVDKSYRALLLKTISSRFFSQDNFSLTDDEIRKQINKKINTGNELEVINILQMLNSQISPESQQLIFRLLDHPSDNIKKETILLIGNRNLKGAENKLIQLASHAEEKNIRWLAVQTLCKDENNHREQLHFSRNPDPYIRSAALSGMLLCSSNDAKHTAEETIHQLILSTNEADQKLAAHILRSVKDHYHHPQHSLLFNASDEIQVNAIKAVGKATTADVLKKVIPFFSDKKRLVLDALQAAGEKAVPVIHEQLRLHILPVPHQEELIALLGKIGGYSSQVALWELLKDQSMEKYRAPIIKALHRSRFTCMAAYQPEMEKLCMEYLRNAAELLFMQQQVPPQHPHYALLIHSIDLELQDIRNILLCLFGCLYDHTKIFKIKQGLDMKKKDTAANALEVIEMTVKKELAVKFNTIYEPAELDHKCYALKTLLPHTTFQSDQEILNSILAEKPICFTTWTKACTLYIAGKNTVPVNKELLQKFIHSDQRILQETARYAI